MNSVALAPIWSATPTPLSANLRVDALSVNLMIQDAVASGISGVFLGGTCGEGPWLPDGERSRLIEAAVKAADGKLKVAAQVSDNSVGRIHDNIARARDAGADYVIIAAPATFMNATPGRVAALFTEAVATSPLPVGIYDLGRHRPVVIPEDRLREVYLLPNVRFIKDSSGSPERRAIALAARQLKPALQLFNGDEFRCVEYLQAGYDGCMFGGAVAAAPQLNQITRLAAAGRWEEARVVDAEMKKILYGIYGGEQIACWLTGLKYYMVRRGLFSSAASYLEFPLTDECRAFIDGQLAAAAR